MYDCPVYHFLGGDGLRLNPPYVTGLQSQHSEEVMIYALFFATMFSLSFAYGVALMAILTPQDRVICVPPCAGFIPMPQVDSANAYRMNPAPQMHSFDTFHSVSPRCRVIRNPSIGQTRLRGEGGRMVGALGFKPVTVVM